MRSFVIAALAAIHLAIFSLPAFGQQRRYTYSYTACPNGQCAYAARPVYQPVRYTAASYTTTATTTTTTYSYTATNYGWFVGWLNGERARYGLAPVVADANLAAWAARNSQEQARRGLGHFIMGSARRQNSAMGAASQIGPMWMGSPAHRSALLDPSIRRVGLAVWGSYWTFNAN